MRSIIVFTFYYRYVQEGIPYFDERDPGPADGTAELREAELYLSGFVKWDGCTELDQRRPHWCGPIFYKKHIELLRYIYNRAFQLMNRETEWDNYESPTYYPNYHELPHPEN